MSDNINEFMTLAAKKVEEVDNLDELKDFANKLIEIILKTDQLSESHERKERVLQQMLLVYKKMTAKLYNSTNILLETFSNGDIDINATMPTLSKQMSDVKATLDIELPF